MKNVIWPIILVASRLAAQAPVYMTFTVCPVEKAVKPLPVKSWEEVAESAVNLKNRNRRAWSEFLQNDSTLGKKGREILYRHKDYPQLIKIEAKSKHDRMLVSTNGANALVAAAAEAYAGHRPLVLSPDMIWLTILQGAGAHIAAHADSLRHHFVDFEGEKKLEVKRAWRKGDPDNPWENVFAEFHEKIRGSARAGVAEALLPRFSTTGIIEQAAMDVTLMHTMDAYFDYRVHFICGIPEITLEGTPEDWALIERHAAMLAAYDLGWWTTTLLPILHEFTEAAAGRANPEFWNGMIMRRSIDMVCTTSPYLTGWILRLFPYIGGKRNAWVSEPEAVERYTNEYTKQLAEIKTGTSKYRRDEPLLDPGEFGLPDLEVSNFPGSMAKANVILNDYGAEYNLELLAGFAGIRQDEKTMALRPEIAWIILDTGLKNQETADGLYLVAAKKILDGEK